MATLTLQSLSINGIIPTYVSASAGGDNFVPSPLAFLHVKNGGGGAVDVTIAVQDPNYTVTGYGDITLANKVINVGAGAEKMIGPFGLKFIDTSTNKVSVTYSGVASVTVAVIG